MTELLLEPVTRLWNRSYILMLILNTIMAVGFFMVNPVLADYAISIGASPEQAGFIAGMFAITALIARPISGIAVDRMNKKHLLLVMTLLLAISSAGYAVAPNFVFLLIVRIIHGFFFGISSTASTSLGSTYIPVNRLGEGMGYLGLSYILAIGIGPAIATALPDYRVSFWGAGLVTAVAAGGMLLLKNPGKQERIQPTRRARIRLGDLIATELLPTSALGGGFALLSGLVGNFIVVLAKERHIADISLFFVVSSVVLLISRPFSGKLIDRKNIRFVLIPAFSASIIAAVLLGAAHTIWLIIAAAVFYAVGQALGSPSIQTYSIRKLGPDRVGVASSTYYIGMDVGQGVGTVLGGFAAGLLGGFGDVFFGAAIILTIALIIFWASGKRN